MLLLQQLMFLLFLESWLYFLILLNHASELFKQKKKSRKVSLGSQTGVFVTGHLAREGGKDTHTSTKREMEEPCGEGRQEKVGSTASTCRVWWSGEVGDDSTFGIPYIWFNWPTVTYSFPTEERHKDRRGLEVWKLEEKRSKNTHQ